MGETEQNDTYLPAGVLLPKTECIVNGCPLGKTSFQFENKSTKLQALGVFPNEVRSITDYTKKQCFVASFPSQQVNHRGKRDTHVGAKAVGWNTQTAICFVDLADLQHREG